MNVEIWSDIVCPWCYIGKRRFEAALAAFKYRDDVVVRWRSFELDPAAPLRRPGSYASRIAHKYGLEIGEARARLATMTSAAADVGLTFNFDLAQPGNTFDGHRLLHLAAGPGLQDALKERLLRATFTEGEPIGDRETLVRLAVEVGLDEADVRAVLATSAYADEVRADEHAAATYGIAAVPFFVIDETYGLSGAQPPHVLLTMLDRAWADTHAAPLVMIEGGIEGGAASPAPSCEDDSCAV